jgi:prepilin-type N-terminal cleavage/methylation domain-containing protein/prepilin-type processing-associated H-X9-DG protein
MNIHSCLRDRVRGGASQPRVSVGRSVPAGFTAVELVAVIVVLALLAAILLPSLSYARNEARTVTCQNRLQAFGQALQAYANANEDYIPGVNTTGLVTRAKNGVSGAMNPHTVPVQSFDWMTPLLQDDPSLPDNRAARFHSLYSAYQCPEQTRTSSLYSTGTTPDSVDFVQFPSWPACSYLMPAYFSYWGRSFAQTVLTHSEANPSLAVLAQVVSSSWEVRSDSYSSHIDQVGPPAGKIFVADGTRYMDASNIISTNISPDPYSYGAFTSLGAWWCGGTEYGVRALSRSWDGRYVNPGSPANGRNLPVSYRHRPQVSGGQITQSGATQLAGAEAGAVQLAPGSIQVPSNDTAQGNTGYINAVFFDGHVATLNDRQSREISLWYPTGSIVTISAEGMTNVPNGTVIP